MHTAGLIFHMAASGNSDGYAITAQNYFSELFGLTKQAPTKQSISEARQKIHHQAFAHLLNKANLEEHIEPLWNGHMVRIVDGTKINTPNTTELREPFEIPNTSSGSAFYPQAWLVTVMNSASGHLWLLRWVVTAAPARESYFSLCYLSFPLMISFY